MNYKTVSPLSESAKEELHRMIKEDPNARIRMRAEAILLSAKGYSIKAISEIKEKHVITVSRWIDQWEERGIDGVLEAEGRGRKSCLTEDEQNEVIKWFEETSAPRSASAVVARIGKAFGKKVSKDTVRRLLKRAGKVWKRVRCSLTGKRDEDSFRLCEQELGEHLQASGRGELRLLYLDESGFNGVSYIPYAWQDKGRTLELPCPKGKRINVLGILSVSEATLKSRMLIGKITSETVLEMLEETAENAATLPIPSVLVIDNASIHTAKIIQAKRPEWEEKKLFLYFLPTYSPELNLIEILWRKVKYEWLPFHAYESFDKLWASLEEIFSGFGDKYNIYYA